MTQIKKTIYFLVCILMGFQIILGLVWVWLNFSMALICKLFIAALLMGMFVLIKLARKRKLAYKSISFHALSFKSSKLYIFSIAFALTYPPVLSILNTPVMTLLPIDLFRLSIPANLANRILYGNGDIGIVNDFLYRADVNSIDVYNALNSRDFLGSYFYKNLTGAEIMELIKLGFMRNKMVTVLAMGKDFIYTLLFPVIIFLKPLQRIENRFVWEYWQFIKEAPKFSVYFFKTVTGNGLVLLIISFLHMCFSRREMIVKRLLKIVLWIFAVIFIVIIWLLFKANGVNMADIAPFVLAWAVLLMYLCHRFLTENKATDNS